MALRCSGWVSGASTRACAVGYLTRRCLHRAAILMGPAGIVAVLVGWVTTEAGRQPYTVYGLLRTENSISPIGATAVASSLLAFVIVYFTIFGVGVFYILRLMNKSPSVGAGDLPKNQPIRAAGLPARTDPRTGVRSMTGVDLPFIWAGLIAFAVLAYVMLDGFDLGVGILFLFVTGEKNRDEMMNSVAPVWDGNETWLVLGGGGLFAVFPLAYSVVMSALYAPIIAMLLGLIFRGVAFEFRWKTQRGQVLWDYAFAGGSIGAVFAQGVALGALVQGIPEAKRAYAGGWWDWLTPFSLPPGSLSLAVTLCSARPG